LVALNNIWSENGLYIPDILTTQWSTHGKTGFSYSLPSFGPGADPGEAVSPLVTISHPPGGTLTLLFARPAVTFPAAEHHCLLAGTKLYCLVTEATCPRLLRSFCPE